MNISKIDLVRFYDELSFILTDWEQGTISDFELYDFMVDIHKKIAEVLN